MKSFLDRALRTACGAALAMAAHVAFAAFPEKAITIVVSDQAGGPGDIVARAMGQQLTETLKQPVVVENRPGAYGTMGLRQVAQAKPDGYTLGIVFMPHTVAQTLFKGTPYQMRKDFTPLAKVADLFNVLLVRNDLPVRTPAELADLAKQRGGQMSFGSGSTGSPAHLSAELFNRQAGVQALHVPFKGPVDALTNLIGGRVDYMFLSLPVAMPMIKSEKVRALAVTGTARPSAMPELRTMKEAGFPDFQVLDWMGLVGPAGMPPDVTATLTAALQKGTSSPTFREKIATLGMEAGFAPGPELGALIDREIGKWEQFIKQVGISIE